MNILIMGPAGSGKGTQSKQIAEDYNIPHISTGDMFRNAIKEKTPLGVEAEQYITQGKLVPDELTIGLVKERLQQEDCQKGYLLDGFPRSLAQAEALEKITQEINRPVELAIHMDVDFAQLAKRITGRRMCKQCGEIYHIDNKPSKVDGICDVCGGNLYQRSDDTEEELQVRLDEYYRNTKPCLEFYQSKGKTRHVNASQEIEKVYDDVKKALATLK
ncbi:MAG: adenylate kinase [Anaerorhabdus sp.]